MSLNNYLRAAFVAVLIPAFYHAPASAIEKPLPQQISGKIQWVYDYEEGQKLSLSSGKPMFVVFRCER